MATQNSFLPEDYLDRKIAKRTNLICIGLFLVMIAAIGAAFYVQNRQDTGTRAELVQVNDAFTKRAEQLRQIKELQDRQQQMIDKAKVVRQLVERVPRSIILAEMVNNMPPALSLLEFDLETKATPAARTLTAIDRAKAKQKKDKNKDAGKVEIVPRQVFVEIEGIAKLEKQITEFMGNLTHHPLFMHVGLEFIEQDTVEKTELFRFRITMELDQSVLIERSAPEDLKRDIIQDPLADNIQINPEGDFTPATGIANTETETD
ncbi:MAG: PilN domain-containing protein [Phycisphaeraceae bacterium]